MGLGTVRAVGTSPPPALVHRLLIQRQMSAWCLFRLDDAGGFVGESWHPDAADALACAICHAHGGQGLGRLATAGYRMKRGRLV